MLFFYKNNFIRPKNTTHHVITCSVSLAVFLQLETLSEQRRKSKLHPHVSYDMFILSICGDNLHDGTRTILKQLRPKLCKNLRTTNLAQNLLVIIKEKRVPQGTVLARLLFLLFIDDIESLTNIDSQMHLFADDCLVHRVIKKDLDCLQLQEDISSLCHLENTWKMTFNKSKCRVRMHMIHKKTSACLPT